jgi:hypothetical protein
MPVPGGRAKEIQVAGIIEIAKNGISEFADDIPEWTWQRLQNCARHRNMIDRSSRF